MKTKSLILFALVALFVSPALFAGGGAEQPAAAGSTSAAPDVGEKEAPSLAASVAAGQLPPLEERLPKDPLVIPPLYSPGRYGGTLEHIQGHDRPGYRVVYLANETIVRFDPEGSEIIPNFAHDFDVSDDWTVYTFYLREGVKWSNGDAFTVEDIRFWYEDLVKNKDLTPTVPAVWRNADGSAARLDILDAHTVRWTYSESRPLTLRQLAVTTDGTCWVPSNYLKQFHINYGDRDEIARLARAESLETWVELFQKKNDWYQYSNPELPVLHPWMLVTTPPATRYILERNPYYWKVDTDGRQLPYIDRWAITPGANKETINLKIIQGEIDHVEGWLEDYTLYKENEAKGAYEVRTYPQPRSSAWMLMPNQTSNDSVLREIFRDVRFRRALSLAVNRDRINEIMYLGLGTPMQTTIASQSPFFQQKWADNFVEFDLDRANALLDEMGLQWDTRRQYRVRPDGRTLSVVIEATNQTWADGFAIVKESWEAIGVQTAWNFTDTANFRNRIQNGDVQVGVWTSGGNYDLSSWFPFIPIHQLLYWGSAWGRWGMTGGAAGEEPPADVKRIISLYDDYSSALTQAERVSVARQIMEIHYNNLWMIGTVSVPVVYIVKDLENVERDTFLDSPVGQQFGKNRVEQWWISQ